MKIALSRSATALAALGTLALVGCASSGIFMKGSAGTILQAANTQALSSSFQVAFTGQLQVDLSRVTPPKGVTAGELTLIQDEVDSARLSAVMQVQSPTEFEMSFTLAPLLTQTWRVLDLNGSEYISENGTQWHSVSSTGAGAVAGGLSNLKTEVKSWGKELSSSATVTKLGTTTIGGNQVEHLQTTIAGSSLNSSMASILGDVVGALGSEGASLNSELPAIEGLLQFTQVKTDSYVLTSSGQLARTDITVGLNLNLAELATLAPAQTGLPAGTASMKLTFSGNFSDYGKAFGLQKPSDIVAGPLPTPSGLASALS
ncbi:MAG TPA: hypothetical protein VMV23_10265 [Candidatus Nanopelagicaceae bacterium]|nr:hypothetical protein [Candidatus Nanopelagicaceae bacterium]